MRGDIADGVADAPVGGGVRPRAVHQQHVMQRHLARLERHVDTLAVGHVDGDLLAAGQQVVAGEGVAMLELVLEMAARPELHGAAFDRCVGEGHPGGDDVVGAEPPVGRVLVPRHEGRRVRLLGEEGRAPAQDVGPDHVLDRVEDLGVARQLVGPGEQEVRLLAHVAAERPAQRALVRLQPVAVGPRLGRRQHADREMETVPAVVRHLGGGEDLGHGQIITEPAPGATANRRSADQHTKFRAPAFRPGLQPSEGRPRLSGEIRRRGLPPWRRRRPQA